MSSPKSDLWTRTTMCGDLASICFVGNKTHLMKTLSDASYCPVSGYDAQT